MLNVDIQIALFLVWIGATVGAGIGAFVASLRFISLHSRRYHEFMSDPERIELFLRQPLTYFTKAVPDGITRSSRLFVRADDPAVEGARGITLRLAAAAMTSAIVGLPVLWLTAGVVRRSGDLLDWVIVGGWLALLAVAVKRRGHVVLVAILILATVGSLLGSLVRQST